MYLMAWPVHGTSGYDFIYLANEGLHPESENQKHFDALYTQVLGRPSDPDSHSVPNLILNAAGHANVARERGLCSD